MPTATRQYRSGPGESWMNSWMFPQSPPPMQQQQPQPQRFNPAALQVTTVRGPGIQPGIQTSPPNPLAMVAGQQPAMQQPMAPLQQDQFRNRPQATPAASSRPAGTGAMSTGTRYMMGGRPDVNPSAAMLELALPGLDPAVAADKARAGQIRNQTRAMAGEHNRYEEQYPPSFGARQAEARAQYARGTFPGQQGPATPWQPLVGMDLSGNLTDAQMAAMYPQGQINNPQTAPGYAAPASPLMMIQEPSQTSLSTISARPGMARGEFQPTTEAGKAAVRSANLRSDPDYRVAVERNRSGNSPVTLNIPGNSPSDYEGKTAAELAGFGKTTDQGEYIPGKRDAYRQRIGYDPALRQQYVRARSMGMNPMTMAANDTVMQGGQLTPEQSLAMQGASPEVVANYMGQRAAADAQLRQADAMRYGYEQQARGEALAAAAGITDPAQRQAYINSIGGQSQTSPDYGTGPLGTARAALPPAMQPQFDTIISSDMTPAKKAEALAMLFKMAGRPLEGNQIIQSITGQPGTSVNQPGGPGLAQRLGNAFGNAPLMTIPPAM